MTVVLSLCGAIAAFVGTWRAFDAVREALGPIVHEGDLTRSAVDAGRPLLGRYRVRLFARRVAVALTWLAVALYGIYLVAVGTAAP